MPDDPTKTQISDGSLGGSVFTINNTSYSGADIKVVVNVYDKGDVARTKAKELEQEIKNADTYLTLLETDLQDLSLDLVNMKRGTPEYQAANARMAKITSEITKQTGLTVDLRKRVKQLRTGLVLDSTKTLAEVQTLSISTHRVKRPVRAFGKVYPVGYTRGSRTIGGSMIFTVFNEHVLYRFLEAHASDFDAVSHTSALLDQMPPVDITIAFANEYGSVSRMALLGVEFINEGQVMSIEDLLTENTVQYVARDYDPMRSVGQRKLDENSILTSEFHGTKASDLIAEEDYQNTKNALDPFERFYRRRDVFV